MNEKEMKRMVFLGIQNHLDAALKECEKIDDLKELFWEKINNLLEEVSKEMIRQSTKDSELI